MLIITLVVMKFFRKVIMSKTAVLFNGLICQIGYSQSKTRIALETLQSYCVMSSKGIHFWDLPIYNKDESVKFCSPIDVENSINCLKAVNYFYKEFAELNFDADAMMVKYCIPQVITND